MSVEQVARDFVARMDDLEMTKKRLTPDATVSGGVLPRPLPAMEAMNIMSGLKTAFPDLHFDIKQVKVDGNIATVNAEWSGTNTGRLSLPVPGLPSIGPTGKRASVKDTYVVTVQGDKISHLKLASPSNGGIPGALSQLGVSMPGM